MRTGLPKKCRLLASTVTALLLAETVFPLTGFADGFPTELRNKVKYVIIIYPENRSFDSLYGSVPLANGLQEAVKKNEVQRQPTGKAFKMPMATVGIWENGVMTEEHLFWDNQTYAKQIGLQ